MPDIPRRSLAASAPAKRPAPPEAATTPPHASPPRHHDEKELRALWRFERDTNKVLQESLDEREAELKQCVDELARLEGYHAFVNDVLLNGGDDDAGGVSSSFAAPEIVIDDPFLLCHAAEGLVLEAVASRRAHLYLLDTAVDSNNGRVNLVSWIVDEDGQRRVVRVPVGGRQDEEEEEEEASAALALTFALQEEEPLLLGGASLVARVVDRAGLVLGLVDIIKRQPPKGSQGEAEGLFTQADLTALENIQDQLASTLLLLRLQQRRRRQQEFLAAAANYHNHTSNNSNTSSRTSSPLRMRGSRALTYTAAAAAAAAPPTGSVPSTTSSPARSNGNGPASPLREAMMRGRDALIREEEERAAVAEAAATRQLQQQQQQQQQILQKQEEEMEGLREKYSKAKIYIRRLEKELRQKVKEQERALLARQATEGAKRLFGKVEEMEALVAELSTRQEQLRQENEALATAKSQVEAAATAAAAHAETKARLEIETLAKSKARAEVELRAHIHQLEREKEAVKAKVARLKAEAKASEGEREQLQHDSRRCHKMLEKSQKAVKQAREYQEITQAELWDLKESLQRMEAGTNELRQQLLCQEGQHEEGGRTRVW